MEIYTRHFRRTVFWFRIQLWAEKKIMKTPPYYTFFQMFSPTKSRGSGLTNLKEYFTDWHLYEKFMRKYPESRFEAFHHSLEPEHNTNAPRHPVNRFVARQRHYMNEGYTEAKAFELVEKEMGEALQQEKYERSLIEGLATSNRARSLMSLYEQAAEVEARGKVERLSRELPDYIRSQRKWEEEISDIMDSKRTETEKEATYNPVSCITKNITLRYDQ